MLAPTISVKVPALHICAGPAPALYCTGLDTGMVVDMGSREAHVVAVYRGSPVLGSYTGAGRLKTNGGYLGSHFLFYFNSFGTWEKYT